MERGAPTDDDPTGGASRSTDGPTAPRADPVLDAVAAWRSHGWAATSHAAAALSLARVDDLMQRPIAVALSPHHLTRSRHEALALIHFSQNGALPLGKLSERLFVHPTSVTSTVDTLERLGYVERAPHPSDRRAVLARITPDGRRAIDSTNSAIDRARHGLDALCTTDADQVFALLRPVRAAAGDLSTADGSDPASDPVLVAGRNWADRGWTAESHFAAALTIYRVREIARASSDHALRRHHLTRARHEALTLISFAPDAEVTIGRLGEMLCVHATSVTSTVDTLERLGYVERAPHPSDRRAVLARITPDGRRAIDGTNSAIDRARHGLDALCTTDADQVFALLRPVRAAAGDLGR